MTDLMETDRAKEAWRFASGLTPAVEFWPEGTTRSPNPVKVRPGNMPPSSPVKRSKLDGERFIGLGKQKSAMFDVIGQLCACGFPIVEREAVIDRIYAVTGKPNRRVPCHARCASMA